MKELFDGYKLNAKEQKNLKKFVKAHKDCCKFGCSNMFTKISRSNGIGDNLYILCWGCKKWDDLADVSCW